MSNLADYLNREFDVADYIESNMPFKRSGSEYLVSCLDPSCDDHWKQGYHLSISPSKRRGYCFKCGLKYGPINIIMLTESITYREMISRYGNLEDAVPNRLRETPSMFKAALEEYFAKQQQNFTVPQIKPPKVELPMTLPLDSIPSAKQYLLDRGFDDRVIRNFNLSYCPTGPHAARIIIPVYFEGKLVSYQGRDVTGTQSPKYLFPLPVQPGDRVKVIEEGEFFDREGSVVSYADRYRVNVRLADNNVLPFRMRQLVNLSVEERGENYANFFFNWDAAIKSIREKKLNFIILVEGVTDLFRLWLDGITNVVATFSKSLKETQRRLLLSTPEIKTVVMFWDGNANKATAKVAEDLSAFKNIRVTSLPHGQEPDTCPNRLDVICHARPWLEMSSLERLEYQNRKPR